VTDSERYEQLRADLIACRGSVARDHRFYERLAMLDKAEKGDGSVAEAEAQRLHDLLDRIDAALFERAPTGEKPPTGRLRTFQRASNGPRTEPRLPSAAYGCRREADGSVCCAAWCGDIERCVRVDVAQWPTDEWYERAWEIASEVAKHNAAPRRLVFAYLVSQEMANRLAAREADRAKEPT
jgi:hypothetical protein